MKQYIKITVTFCLLLVLGIGATSAQQAVDTSQVITVIGKVVSVNDDEPLIGATVVVKGTRLGCVTDYEGNFCIKAVTVNDPSSEKTVRLIPSKPQSGWIYLSAISSPREGVHPANATASAPAASPPKQTMIQASSTD